jgi:nucleotide-binding universal stress UspA family protein
MRGRVILVPLDGSQQAEAALPYAEAIASVMGDGIRLFGVTEPESSNPILIRLQQDLEIRTRLAGQAQSYLNQVASRASPPELEVSSVVAEGDPATEILRAAQAADIVLIAMVTHGRSGLQRWALGSVADKVMRMSQVPTLLIRPPETQAKQEPVALKRLLVPLDGSAMAESAIEPAARLSQATGATLILLRVEPWLSTNNAFVAEGVYSPDFSEFESEQQVLAQQYLDGLRDQLPDGLACQTLVLRGFPSPMLKDYCTSNQIDLVVMSTHGRSGVARFVVGSKADNLVRSGAPVLLIPPREVFGEAQLDAVHVAKGPLIRRTSWVLH